MPNFPTMKDEYEILVDELRQNRQIQLQAFLSSPIWLSLFFGLMSFGEVLERMPFFVLLPIPLILLNLLLIVDRRRGSDVIIAYFRTAFDQRLVDQPAWHSRLPQFRRILKTIQIPTDKTLEVPQRFDFNIIVWLSYLTVALICLGLYWLLSPQRGTLFWILVAITMSAFMVILVWIIQLANIKLKLIKAWEETLSLEAKGK
ncbi:MAG: hypothetical protein ACE5MH_03465 [Terriglobia bacterium]